MTEHERIDRAIQANLPAFRRPGILTVRPGYRLVDGWITPEPAIVVTAAEGRPKWLPFLIHGYPVDVRPATRLQRLRHEDPLAYARALATLGPERLPQEFRLERRASSGHLISPAAAGAGRAPAPASSASPPSALAPVTDRMSITCCAGQASAWAALTEFVAGAERRLTVGLHDFGSARAWQAIEVARARGDRRSRQGLGLELAVRDGRALWLSSGRRDGAMAGRAWHVVVRHPGLAQTFEAYLKEGLGASEKQAAPAADPAWPEQALGADVAPEPGARPFEVMGELVTVQALLTPDAIGVGHYTANLLRLIESAAQTLHVQMEYVRPPEDGCDAELRGLFDAVAAKMRAGLDVRIILGASEQAGGQLERLQAMGWDLSRVRLQEGVRNQGLIVDSRVVAVGGQVWSCGAAARDRSATLVLSHAGAAQYFERTFLHDWKHLAHQRLVDLPFAAIHDPPLAAANPDLPGAEMGR
jgi:hypothetical protein